MKKQPSSLLAVAFASVFIALGSALLCLQYDNLRKARASASRVPTRGTITHVDYERTSHGRRTSNSPIVTYRYTVDGRSYFSSVRAFGDDMGAKDIFREYKPDAETEVFYDPANPADAVLVPGVGTWTIVGLQYAWLIFGFGAAYLLVVCVRIAWRRRIPNKALLSDAVNRARER